MRARNVGAFLLLALLVGCASGVQRSGVETAKLVYADASFAYDDAMTSLVEINKVHPLSDRQVAILIQAQEVVQIAAPRVRSAIKLWESSGQKPPSYDAIVKEVLDALKAVLGVVGEVKHG